MDDVEVILVALLRRGRRARRPRRARSTCRTRSCSWSAARCSGFVPGLPDVELDPDLVLVIFLPPLLYSGAFFANLRDLQANLRPITLLSIGLVLATVAVVACGRARADRRAVLAGGVRARRDRRADRPGRGDRRSPAGSACRGGSSPCSRARRWSTTRPRSSPTGSRSRRRPAPAFSLLGRGLGVRLEGRRRRRRRAGGRLGHRRDPPAARRPADREHDRPADAPTRPTCRPSSCDVSAVLAAVTVGVYVGWRAPEIASPAHAAAGLRRCGSCCSSCSTRSCSC